jgi:AP-4 complex subunit beta-1
MIENNNYLERLHTMLFDVDATVVINAIYVIDELQLSTGGLQVTQQLLMALLTRVGEFSEWGLNTILGLVSRYVPASEDETYGIMNLLDPVLRTANSGAVLATFKAFTSLTSTMPDLQPQIYQRGGVSCCAVVVLY